MNKHTIQEWANFIGCDITYSKKSGLGFWYYEIIVMIKCHYYELNPCLISDFDLYVNTHGDTGCVKPVNAEQQIAKDQTK